MADKFKIGDKVKVISSRNNSKKHCIGECFTINQINPNGLCINRHYGTTDQESPCRQFIFFDEELELIKPKFDIKNYPGKYVMCCKTYAEAERFYKYISSIRNEDFLTPLDSMWKFHNNNLCFNLDYRGYCGETFYKYINYTILYFEDFDWSDFEMKKEFTKADLKNGDVVKLRDGDVGIAIVDIGVISFGRQMCNLINYRDNLTNMIVKDCDIVAIRRPCSPNDCTVIAFDNHRGTLVYERKEVEEMTLEEVCKALGKEIKIVKK